MENGQWIETTEIVDLFSYLKSVKWHIYLAETYFNAPQLPDRLWGPLDNGPYRLPRDHHITDSHDQEKW